MARPLKDGLDYFPHDVYASSDVKLEPLIATYGAKGYGFYFMHLEYIYRNGDCRLDVKNKMNLRTLCSKLQVSEKEYQEILNMLLELGCFDNAVYKKTGCLTSNGIQKRSELINSKRRKARERFYKKVPDGVFDEITPSETTQSKVKESKVKESKVNKDTPTENVEDAKKKHITKPKGGYSDEFEEFYKTYPRPEEKVRTHHNWQKRVKQYTASELLQSAKNYALAKTGTELRYMKSSANFLGEEMVFQDYISAKASVPVKASRYTRIGRIPDFERIAND